MKKDQDKIKIVKTSTYVEVFIFLKRHAMLASSYFYEMFLAQIYDIIVVII